MDEQRANPDELLRVIRREEKSVGLGRLTIFFGYAAGVGKTYAMLEAAHAALQQGIDVAVGYVEPHARAQTTALLEGLEQVPAKSVEHGGIVLREMDLDAVLARAARLVLVDELAHTNAPGSRHEKRYQDVEELLRAGIDVYTTVNVQHIESLNDVVASITGVIVRERIPDHVFDKAAQVELVDIEPSRLIERLGEGRIYRDEQARRAAENFFRVENLTALREIALRRCADRVNLQAEAARAVKQSGYHTDEHILVCLSASPSNAKIIRTAARMASAFRGRFTALFVETSDFPDMDEQSRQRLRANLHLAQQLGATVETMFGDDIAYQIAEFARLSGVSKIVLGRSNARRRYPFSRASLTESLVTYAPGLDIHIIPDKDALAYRAKRKRKSGVALQPADVLKSVGILVAATIAGAVFERLGFSEANIITVYILGVLITSVITTHRMYSLASSVLSVLVFNFFFTDPRYSLNAYDTGYPVTFFIMLLSAFITSSLAVRMKQHAKQAAQTAYRTKTLFETNQLLQQVQGRDELISVTAKQLNLLLARDVVFYPEQNGTLLEPRAFAADGGACDAACVSENERAVAAWVFQNNKHAGATTGTLANAKCLYLAVRVGGNVYGVVGIVMGEEPLENLENSILLSVLGECALALENEKILQDKEEAAVLAKNEQLRANLLRAISHDLRTPLTSISGHASNLISNSGSFDEPTKQRLYADIYDDSQWLINLVENLLSVTRIEEGRMNLHLSAELIGEVIDEALAHVGRKSAEHRITVENRDEFAFAKIDIKLIVQVIINIVDNAVKYTPPGCAIAISTFRRGGMVVVEIADDGPGMTDEMKAHVFDMFYTGANQIADSRRSLGLGLSLCKSIIHIHGGEISVRDGVPGGTVFAFTLPAEEVELHE